MTETDEPEVTVTPLDEDGVGAVAIGTVLWLIALVVLLVLACSTHGVGFAVVDRRRGDRSPPRTAWIVVHHAAASRLPPGSCRQ